MSQTVVNMMSELEMLGFLKTNGTQSRFVAIVTKTPVVKIKAKNPWGAGKSKTGLYKVSRKLGIINANYNTSVRNRIAEKLGVQLAEVEYENGEVWYEHLKTADGKNLPVVQHKDEAKRDGQYYLQYYPHKSTNAYVNEAGEPEADAVVEPWLYKESERPDYKPTVIAVNLRNVKQLKASGVIIEMPAFEEAEALLAD
jgi:hypothetical protein